MRERERTKFCTLEYFEICYQIISVSMEIFLVNISQSSKADDVDVSTENKVKPSIKAKTMVFFLNMMIMMPS